ncbi:MAG: hypothetical protein HY514_04090 [Candidatus Aenigmarchaeota archaeon]|nr:hypothetical protein [Candidatus Aenigmarchaeota archaeon]
MDDDEIAQNLKTYLQTRGDQDSKNTYIGYGQYSVRELYTHVDQRTEIGREFIELSRRLIEKIGREQWERSLV